MRTDRRNRCLTFLFTVLLVTVSSPMIAGDQTTGWFKAGSDPNDYDMGTDVTQSFTGGASGYIRNNKPNPKGFGTYMQMFDATNYRGLRVRFSAFVKSENVENWAGIWMRVDGQSKPTAFYNMQDRPIKGTTSWANYAVVLDVDPHATAIAFGILMEGKGAVWMNDVKFEAVNEDVQVSQFPARPSAPVNLDFENGPAPKR